jgi:hypothetical protein
MVYFSVIISTNAAPQEVINCTAHEWNKASGTRLQIKDLQHVDSEMVVSLVKVSTTTSKDVILEELKRILKVVQARAEVYENIDPYKYDFSMESDVDLGKSLPAMNLCIQHAKLQGVGVSTFKMLKHHAQMVCQSWHLEVISKHVPKMKLLVQFAKETGVVEKLWGRQAHLAKSLTKKFHCKGSQETGRRGTVQHQLSSVYDGRGFRWDNFCGRGCRHH